MNTNSTDEHFDREQSKTLSELVNGKKSKMTKENDLLPCPFCGSNPILYEGYVYCSNNKCVCCEIETADIKDWNTRHEVSRELDWDKVISIILQNKIDGNCIFELEQAYSEGKLFKEKK